MVMANLEDPWTIFCLLT